MLSRLLMLALLLATIGCQSTLHKGPTFTEVAPPDHDRSLVYLFRIGSTPLYVDAPMHLDGKVIVDMPNRGYLPLYVKPGPHTIGTRWGIMAGQRNIEQTFNFVAGKTHYIALTKSDVTNIKVLLDPNHYLGEFTRENAIGGLSQCMLVVQEKE